ncbi:MAG: hypothetical protein ACWA5X_13970 [bacterium]
MNTATAHNTKARKNPLLLTLAIFVGAALLTAITVQVAKQFDPNITSGSTKAAAGQSMTALQEVKKGVTDYWEKNGRMPHHTPLSQLGIEMEAINNLDAIRYVSLAGSAADPQSTTIKAALKPSLKNEAAGHLVFMQITAEEKGKRPTYHCYVRGPNNQAPRTSLDNFPPACRHTHAEIPHMQGVEKRRKRSDAFQK